MTFVLQAPIPLWITGSGSSSVTSTFLDSSQVMVASFSIVHSLILGEGENSRFIVESAAAAVAAPEQAQDDDGDDDPAAAAAEAGVLVTLTGCLLSCARDETLFTYQYWKETGDASIFDSEWIQAITNILSTFKEQQRKEGVGPYKFQRTAPSSTHSPRR